jgi:hypothetical protein
MKHILIMATLPTLLLLAACSSADEKAASITGVAECDNYLIKLRACIKMRIPPENQDRFLQMLDETEAKWLKISDKQALAKTCQDTIDDSQIGMGGMGCSF